MVSQEQWVEAPIIRQQIFVLADGTLAVQWSSHYVQELLTGKYRTYQFHDDFGCPIADFELRQLKMAGYIKAYDRHNVRLFALPQLQQTPRNWELSTYHTRAYYINTTLHSKDLEHVRNSLHVYGFDAELWARERGEFTVLMAQNGAGIRSFEEAEQYVFRLRSLPTTLFDQAIVSFIQTQAPMINYFTATDNRNYHRSDIFADFDNQREFSVAEDKVVVMAIPEKDEQQAIQELLESMDLEVHLAGTGRDTIFLLEDYDPDLLILDMNLNDMHAWKLLLELKERVDISELPIMVLMDEAKVMPLDHITTVVRPVGLAQLRHTIWSLLTKDGTDERPSP